MLVGASFFFAIGASLKVRKRRKKKGKRKREKEREKRRSNDNTIIVNQQSTVNALIESFVLCKRSELVFEACSPKV